MNKTLEDRINRLEKIMSRRTNEGNRDMLDYLENLSDAEVGVLLGYFNVDDFNTLCRSIIKSGMDARDLDNILVSSQDFNSLNDRISKLEAKLKDIKKSKKKFEFAGLVEVNALLAEVAERIGDVFGGVVSDVDDGHAVISIRPDIADQPDEEGYIEVTVDGNKATVEYYDWEMDGRDKGLVDDDYVEVNLMQKTFDQDVAAIVDCATELVSRYEDEF